MKACRLSDLELKVRRGQACVASKPLLGQDEIIANGVADVNGVGKKRPNMFLSFRLASTELTEALQIIQHCMSERKAGVESYFTSPAKAHLTAFVFSIDSEEEIERVRDCLRACANDVAHICSEPDLEAEQGLRFTAVDCFSRGRVIFARPSGSGAMKRLRSLYACIKARFNTAGICQEDTKDVEEWEPHLTIAKITFPQKRHRADASKQRTNLKRIEKEVYAGLDSHLSRIRVMLTALELCQMGGVGVDGYYPVLESIDISGLC